MQMSSFVFDKRQRRLIYELISGQIAGSVAIANYSNKIQSILSDNGIELQLSTIRQVLWWSSNNQPVFQAAYDLLKKERPIQLENLFSGHVDLQPA